MKWRHEHGPIHCLLAVQIVLLDAACACSLTYAVFCYTVYTLNVPTHSVFFVTLCTFDVWIDVPLRDYSLLLCFCHTVYIWCIIEKVLSQLLRFSVPPCTFDVQVDVQCALVHSAMSAQKSTLSRSCQRKLEVMWRKVCVLNRAIAYMKIPEKS